MFNKTVVSRHSVLPIEFRRYAVVNKIVVRLHKKKLSVVADISSVLCEKILLECTQVCTVYDCKWLTPS